MIFSRQMITLNIIYIYMFWSKAMWGYAYATSCSLITPPQFWLTRGILFDLRLRGAYAYRILHPATGPAYAQQFVEAKCNYCFIVFYQLFEFNCQASRRSSFLFRVVRQSNCSGMQYALRSGGHAKCLRTLPAQCVGCGHEHQNQSRSKNYQSSPLECRLPLTHKREGKPEKISI